ncbi:alpha/beta-hydrolase [Xylariomycetidae sp. FL2044]|nr:alpha/beta-hydrolase [Xylariomycetidae sp. FL2044]
MAARMLVLLLLYQLFCAANAVDPLVKLDCNTYAGVAQANGITQWLGMRFAAPPVGDLRFEPPEDAPCTRGVQAADHFGKLCFATGNTVVDETKGEDCLFINVWAPSNATARAKLPVYFFIQGGGFNDLTNPYFDGRGLIQASGDSIIVVTFNYRVGPYGFITDGDTITPNIGLLDQRKALEWVQDYISQFGGDPGHVVLGGDSAGAASVSLQLTAYNGKATDLFHAGAAESVSFATVLTVKESQYLYDNFAIRLGCVGKDSLACLKSKSATELQAMNMGIPYPGSAGTPVYTWNPVLDGSLISDYPYNLYAQGKFVKVPVIIGDDTNGGTVFTPRTISTLGGSLNFLHTQFPYLTFEQLDEISSLYPNTNLTCPNPGCYWRQVSDAYGDMRYMCPGLFISTAMAQHGVGQSYNYRYNVEDPEQVAEGEGVPHTVELAAIWGPENMGEGSDPPASYYPNGSNAAAVPMMQGYWTSFIRTFDPNKYREPGSAIWEVWSQRAQSRMLFETGGKSRMEILDDKTKNRCDYFSDIGVDIRQ